MGYCQEGEGKAPNPKNIDKQNVAIKATWANNNTLAVPQADVVICAEKEPYPSSG